VSNSETGGEGGEDSAQHALSLPGSLGDWMGSGRTNPTVKRVRKGRNLCVTETPASLMFSSAMSRSSVGYPSCRAWRDATVARVGREAGVPRVCRWAYIPVCTQECIYRVYIGIPHHGTPRVSHHGTPRVSLPWYT